VIKTDEDFTGKCLELPWAISEGNTLEDLKKNMTETS
jgi:predicted RNase H-like HicB family nuclease